ncbi:hypothetical protein D0S45_17920 [Marinifilum sp. JC120]|nr:hypothetical protein D0S45_17920 [Marinifilum sp. JC120]
MDHHFCRWSNRRSDTFASGTTYSVFFALADGSKHDDDSVDGKITDQVVLGTSAASGSGSGYVFNLTQTFGMEWMMLMFALVADLRNNHPV